MYIHVHWRIFLITFLKDNKFAIFQEGRTLTQNESKESKHNWKAEREEIPEPGPPARPPIPQRLIGEFRLMHI
jgi:hypothetical protein